MSYRKSAALSIFNNCHQNLSHSFHQNILTENTDILTMTEHFHYLVCKQWHKDLSFWWHWHVHWHKDLLVRDELSILSKLRAFAGNPLCGAVCANCFEKCAYRFTKLRMIREIHQSDWEKLWLVPHPAASAPHTTYYLKRPLDSA